MVLDTCLESQDSLMTDAPTKSDFVDAKKAFNSYASSESKEPLLFEGDALDVLSDFPDECVDMVITSPPYYMKREYLRITYQICSFLILRSKHWANGTAEPLFFTASPTQFTSRWTRSSRSG